MLLPDSLFKSSLGISLLCSGSMSALEEYVDMLFAMWGSVETLLAAGGDLREMFAGELKEEPEDILILWS